MKKLKIDVAEPGEQPVNDKVIGTIGENAARVRLEENGYKIICRNSVLPGGELDIVAYESGTLVFVEVKTRLKMNLYRPSDNVTGSKTRKIKHLANTWLSRNKKYSKLKIRYDVVEVILDEKTFEAKEIVVNKGFFE